MHARLKQEDPPGYQATRNATCEKMRKAKGPEFKHSDRTRKKMSLSHTGVPRQPHSTETRAKISLSKAGKKVQVSAESRAARSHKQKQRWAERKQDSASFAEYIKLLSSLRKEYIRSHGTTRPKKGKKTGIEARFETYLVEHQLAYTFQYFLDGKYYDFFLPDFNLLVEVDGEYWHRLSPAIKNDIEKHVIARDQGIRLLRITEKCWKPELIFENDYSIIQQHNYRIINLRTTQCQNYELSISLI
jgi:very-short-patch-repair endonuclease